FIQTPFLCLTLRICSGTYRAARARIIVFTLLSVRCSLGLLSHVTRKTALFYALHCYVCRIRNSCYVSGKLNQTRGSDVHFFVCGVYGRSPHSPAVGRANLATAPHA